MKSGEDAEYEILLAIGNEAVSQWARATRAFTRAQVRALQVYQALVPPPHSPEQAGLCSPHRVQA